MEELTSKVLDGTVTITLLFFAKARELMGMSQMEVEIFIGPYTLQMLHAAIMNLCKALKPIENHFVLALNEEYVEEGDRLHLKAGDTLAIIPPLSGG